MTALNSDIYQHIFDMLAISDKRSFLRTCMCTNKLSIQMKSIENEFQKTINEINYLDRYYYYLYDPLCKYTVELLFDGNTVPDRYITTKNRILHQYPKIYKRLAKKGEFELIKKMLNLDRNSYIDFNYVYVMLGAAKVGNILMLQWMFENGYRCESRVASYAAKGNQLETLKWITNEVDIDSSAMTHAAKKGHIDIIEFLIVEKKCKIRKDVCYHAAANGHFNVVKYLHSVNPNALSGVCVGAAKSGNVNILNFAYENGYVIDDHFYCEHIQIFDWLFDKNQISANINLSKKTAQSGNLECMKFLHGHNFLVAGSQVFEKATIGGNIEMIKWLHEIGCPFSESAANATLSVRSNQIKSVVVLKLLIEWGCSVPQNFCAIVALDGNLEMLKYLHSLGHSLNSDVISAAATGGHLHVIIWCREQGCPWDRDACNCTVRLCHLNVLKWLRGVGRQSCGLDSTESELCPWDERVCVSAIQLNDFDILEFAIENGCSFGLKSYLSSKECSCPKIKKYVREKFLK